jgi:hypothetical protein
VHPLKTLAKSSRMTIVDDSLLEVGLIFSMSFYFFSIILLLL